MKWKNKLDPVLTKICLYIIGTIAILYVLYHAGNSLFSLLMMLIKLIGTIFHLLVPVFWGFFLAYLLMPITDFLQKKLAYSRFNKKNKSCRGFAVALTIMIIAAFFVASSVAATMVFCGSCEKYNKFKICVEGSLYKHLFSFNKRVSNWLTIITDAYPSIHYEITDIPNSTLIGAYQLSNIQMLHSL